MNTLSKEQVAIANENQSIFLQRLADTCQNRVALDLGVGEDVISKFKKEKLRFSCEMLAFVGLKVVTITTFTADPAIVQATETIVYEYFRAKTAMNKEMQRIIDGLNNKILSLEKEIAELNKELDGYKKSH